MTRVARFFIRLSPFLAAVACLDTGQDRASVPLRLAGATPSVLELASAWSVELSRAELAFGPLYLCPGFQAGSLCEIARLEWTESAVVDGLDPSARDAGLLKGATGPVRSWMYDLGISSLLTQQQPLALSAALELGNNSVRVEGIARNGVHAIPFLVELPVQQEEQTEVGVSVVRKSGSDRFEHDVTGDEAALTVRFDPAGWVQDIDFDALVEDAPCGTGAGGSGCVDQVRFAPDSQGYRAVRGALTAGERPAFEWSEGL
ncbi:MAG: hypothetical protein RL685_910 [Pseudomonadota bacterium]|jgi:hypothetical protein